MLHSVIMNIMYKISKKYESEEIPIPFLQKKKILH